jgi:hypothetical protein
MISRCYGPQKLRQVTYAGCTVCDEWHNFQAFAEWNTQQRGYGEGWHIDKDLIVKGNKVYQPDRCCLLPPDVNTFLLRRQNDRGPWPIGVTLHRESGRFFAQLSVDKHQIVLGTFDNPDDAYAAYKAGKEREARKLAEKYKDQISAAANAALCAFTVEVTD